MLSRPFRRMRLRSAALAFLAVISISAVPVVGAAPTPGTSLQVTGTGGAGLRLREQPDAGSAILALVPEGATVIASGQARNAGGYEWALVRYNETSGWVVTAFLGAAGVAAPATSQPSAPSGSSGGGLTVGGRATVSGTDGDNLRIRNGVGVDAPIVGQAPPGATVTITAGPRADATGATWYGVDYSGLRGWAIGRYLVPVGAAPAPSAVPVAPTAPATQPSAASGQGSAIVTAALRYLGAPYVWGGNSPSGWDCSGFVVYIFQQVTGRTLPRTTQAQFGVGSAVAPNDIRAGDLVFFANTYAPGITHVGIALGDGRFVHARSPSYGTVVTSLSDPYYTARFAGARRV